MVKHNLKNKKDSRKERRKNERTLEEDYKLADDYQENKELDNDFFMEDADEVDFRQLNDDDEEGEHSDMDDAEFDQGSDLDFDDENYSESDKEEKQKGFKLTLKKFKSIKKKAMNGSSYHINQCIVFFSKAFTGETDVAEQDEGDSENEDKPEKKEVINEENILLSKSGCSKVIKFNLTQIPELLQIKQSKLIVKRYLGVITKFIKNGDNWDPSLIASAFNGLTNHINLVKFFKKYTETLIKLAIKYWLEMDVNLSDICFEFLREVALSNEFDYVLKSCYLGFLTYAKSMNKATYERIMKMKRNIVDLILAADQDVAYKMVFLFLRKMCIELNRTISDKKWNSIKNIYNWQVINSLMLWTDVIVECYKGNLNKNFELLTYPLIQIIVGVIRLHFVSNFFPLRVNLIKLLIKISEVSGIFIPVSGYFIEMLEHNCFLKYYKGPKEPKQQTLDGLTGVERKKMKEKIKRKEKQQNEVVAKHPLSKDESADFNSKYLHITLKIKEFSKFDTINQLAEVILNTLIEYCRIHANKLTFPEIIFPIVTYLKKQSKKVQHYELKEQIKNTITLLTENSDIIINSRCQLKAFDMNKISLAKAVERKLKEKKLPLVEKVKILKKQEKNKLEAIKAKEEGEFIEI